MGISLYNCVYVVSRIGSENSVKLTRFVGVGSSFAWTMNRGHCFLQHTFPSWKSRSLQLGSKQRRNCTSYHSLKRLPLKIVGTPKGNSSSNHGFSGSYVSFREGTFFLMDFNRFMILRRIVFVVASTFNMCIVCVYVTISRRSFKKIETPHRRRLVFQCYQGHVLFADIYTPEN